MKMQKIIRDMTIREVSTVDKPAQRGAVAVITKRADPEPSAEMDIRKNASEVASGQAEPLYKASDYSDAIMARAEELGEEQGCSASKALLDLSGSDPVITELAKAERAAEFDTRSKKHSSRLGKVEWKPVTSEEDAPVEKWCLKCGAMFMAARADQVSCEGRNCANGS